ncbi:MAG: EamA family transporter [Actinomycetales bacterium]
MGGILSVQVGAALAKGIFDLVPPTAMVWMRLATSALVFALFFRPVLRGKTRGDWAVALGFGLCLMGMNWCIYQSFARIPLGMAVTLEFLGPFTLSLLGSRRMRDLIWVLLAGSGVLLLGFDPTGLTVSGVALALAAGVLWAGYILMSERTGRRWQGVTGLTVASMVGAVVMAGPAIAEAGQTLLEPRILAIGLAVGLLSSVVPYSLELVALRQIRPSVFAILMSLEPAAAALAALLLLGEALSWLQWIAVGCVVLASIGATRGMAAPPPTGGAEA